MSEADIAVILEKLSVIEAQVRLTNGRVTKLERGALIALGVLIGAGALKLGVLSAFGL
jgi:hypothetical protein